MGHTVDLLIVSAMRSGHVDSSYWFISGVDIVDYGEAQNIPPGANLGFAEAPVRLARLEPWLWDSG